MLHLADNSQLQVHRCCTNYKLAVAEEYQGRVVEGINKLVEAVGQVKDEVSDCLDSILHSNRGNLKVNVLQSIVLSLQMQVPQLPLLGNNEGNPLNSKVSYHGLLEVD